MAYNPNNPNGQATMANSAPVAIASNQSAVPVSNAGIPTALGQNTMANSMPVAIASNQSAVPISNAGLATALGRASAAASMPVTLSNEDSQEIKVTGQAAQTAIVNNILTTTAGAAATDITGERSLSIQVVSTGTGGTYIFEGSNDNVNFQAIPVYNQALAVAVPIVTAITATATQIIYVGAINFTFIRLRIVTAITGGSIQAFSRFSQSSFGATSQVVANGTAANLLATVSGTVTANIGTGALAAGTNAIGDVGVQYRANATGAALGAHLVAAASTNATIVKAAAGRVVGWYFVNTNAAVRYVKLHNQATAPTAGTGVVRTIAIPPNSVSQFKLEGGIAFATGIALTTVTGAADADATAVAANDIVGDIFYQ